MKGIECYRQGDVVLIPVKQLPKGLTKKDNVLAYGEVTGHKHLMTKGDVFTNGQRQYVVLEQPTELVHEEHSPQTIQKGVYQVNIKNELDLLGQVRAVSD